MQVTVALIIVGLGILTPAAGAQVDRDCADFPDQAAAQQYFIQQGGPTSDPDRLDGDHDGVACDSLPCPCGADQPPPTPIPAPQAEQLRPTRAHFAARVTRVVDGDTIKVRSTGGRRFTIRLLGIDTPEVFGREECGGKEASARMKRIAPRGSTVRVTGDYTQPNRDRYSRVLAYVKTGSTQLNVSQVRAGWARVYVVGRAFLRAVPFVASQRDAFTWRQGVWGACGGSFDRPI